MQARLVVGGGIGSGKSTAVECFARMGAHVISADDVARGVLAPGTPAAAAVAARWPEVVTDGVIDRARLGRIVFSSPTELAELEEITHPETRRQVMDEAASHGDRGVVVEMPILRDWFEGWTLVVVDAPESVRMERVLARADSTMTGEDVRAVMSRQPTRAEWLLAADFVVDNAGDPKRLAAQCREIWERVTV